MKTYSFENLQVWQDTRLLSTTVYALTSKFPPEEKFGITNQMRRSAISVCSNIAEGTSRHSRKEQVRFYEIAYGSLMELLSQSLISNDLKMLDEESLKHVRKLVDMVSSKLSNLREAQLKRNSTPKP